jgi:hypothetical protein
MAAPGEKARDRASGGLFYHKNDIKIIKNLILTP